MTTLRVRLTARPAPARADAWALYDSSGSLVKSGVDRPEAWPSADRIEYVLAASQVRIACITLPPMTQSRLAGAVGFALEDQLAGAVTAHHLAASDQAPDGRVRVAIIDRSRLAEFAERNKVSRMIAEPELAQPLTGWRWCAQSGGSGFLLREDRSAFPVDAPTADGALPSEIAVALAQARRDGHVPESIRVDAPLSDASLSRLQREAGIPVMRGTPWRWEDATADRFADAVDLVPASGEPASVTTRRDSMRAFAPALALAAAAIAIHLIAGIGEWAALRIDAWRDARDWQALAAAAGVPRQSATTPRAARSALARRYAEMRHLHGLPAPDDALPLLARAAPALASLPPGSVKSAGYADGHWTLELAKADPTVASDLEVRMRREGVPALVAASQGGVRVRFGGAW